MQRMKFDIFTIFFHSNQLNISTATESISMILDKDQSIERDKVIVNNNTAGVSTIINILADNEEIEGSSIISGFEMSDVQMAELVSVRN